MRRHLSAAARPSLPRRAATHPGSTAGPHPARFAARTRIRWEKTTAVAVKIKLKRLGKIRAPYYRIVVADARTKRDGRAIEEIGKYHPKAEPSFIEVDSERAQHWLSVGAQPTDPVRKILEITGDWQKFKGLPGTEGTLRIAAPKQDRKEIFAAARPETLADSGAATPKGGGRGGPRPGTPPRRTPAAKADPRRRPRRACEGGRSRKADGQPRRTRRPRRGKADKADGAKDGAAKAKAHREGGRHAAKAARPRRRRQGGPGGRGQGDPAKDARPDADTAKADPAEADTADGRADATGRGAGQGGQGQPRATRRPRTRRRRAARPRRPRSRRRPTPMHPPEQPEPGSEA